MNSINFSAGSIRPAVRHQQNHQPRQQTIQFGNEDQPPVDRAAASSPRKSWKKPLLSAVGSFLLGGFVLGPLTSQAGINPLYPEPTTDFHPTATQKAKPSQAQPRISQAQPPSTDDPQSADDTQSPTDDSPEATNDNAPSNGDNQADGADSQGDAAIGPAAGPSSGTGSSSETAPSDGVSTQPSATPVAVHAPLPVTKNGNYLMTGNWPVSPEFKATVNDFATRRQVPADWIMSMFSVETGGSFDPTNQSGSGQAGGPAVGIFQFTPDVYQGWNIAWQDIVKMPATEQIKLTERYFDAPLNEGLIRWPGDMYAQQASNGILEQWKEAGKNNQTGDNAHIDISENRTPAYLNAAGQCTPGGMAQHMLAQLKRFGADTSTFDPYMQFLDPIPADNDN